MRQNGVKKVCPLCREMLPPGREKLYELGQRIESRLFAKVNRRVITWSTMSPRDQKDMNDAITMWTEVYDIVIIC